MFRCALFSLAAGTALVALLAAASAGAQTAPTGNLYVFGDSDSDQGNLSRMRGEVAADRPLYYCPGDACRDSNGPVWVERLGRPIDAVLTVTPGADPRRGLNFAVSGGHMTAAGEPFGPLAGVTTQVAAFGALADSGTIKVSPRDLFVVQAGPNDLLRVLAGESPATVADQIAGASVANVAALARRGARTILFAEVQPVQLLPALGDPALAGLRAFAAGYVRDLNRRLQTDLTAAAGSLPPGTNLILVRQEAFFAWLAANRGRLGLAPLDQSCLGPDGTPCAADAAGQNRYVWYDSNHFTAGTHALWARWNLATLAAATGGASRQAALLPDLVLAHGTTLREAAEQGWTTAGPVSQGVRLFVTPLLGHGRFQSLTDGQMARTRTEGGMFGVAADLGVVHAGVAAGWSRARTTFADGGSATERGISLHGFVDAPVAGGRLRASISWAAPEIAGFRRITGMANLVAQGQSRARYVAGSLGYSSQLTTGALVVDFDSAVTFERARVRGFREQDARGLELAYDAQRVDRWRLDSRVDVGYRIFGGAGGTKIVPFATLRDATGIAGGRHVLRSQLVDNLALPALTASGRSAQNSSAIGGGLRLDLGARFRLTGTYLRTVAGPEDKTSRFALQLGAIF